MQEKNPLNLTRPPLQSSGSVLNSSRITTPTTPTTAFKVIKNNHDLDAELLQAQQNNKIMLLDFYADWCISCKDLDNTVFSDPEVKKELQSLHVVRADVTSNDMMDKAIQERFNVIAPPTMLFFDEKGNEFVDFRIVGEISKSEFLDHLTELTNKNKK